MKEPQHPAALLRRFAASESAATAMEYALVAAAISVALAAMFGLGADVGEMFGTSSDAIGSMAD